MKTGWLFVLLGILCASAVRAEFQSATISDRFSAMADANSDGVPDSLMDYLIASGATLPDPYDPSQSDLDGDGYDDLSEWILLLQPLVAEPQSGSSGASPQTSTGIVFRIVLPPWIQQYAELFGKESLIDENLQWEPLEEWIPTYGEQTVDLVISTESNRCFFIKPSDATWDFDGDGHSDMYEYYAQTDQTLFNYVDSEPDGMHDWWELKLFGSLDENPFGDFDGDGLLNGEELVWLSTSNIVMFSDPSLYDSDGDTLNDAEEIPYQTDPMAADTDTDGFKADAEIFGAPPTDPLNPDITSPVITFTGSF